MSPNKEQTPFKIHPDDAAQMLVCLTYKNSKQMKYVDAVAQAIRNAALDTEMDRTEANHAMLGIALETVMPHHHHQNTYRYCANGEIMNEEIRHGLYAVKGRPIVISTAESRAFKGKNTAEYQKNIQLTKNYMVCAEAEANKPEIVSPLAKAIYTKAKPAPVKKLSIAEEFALIEAEAAAERKASAEAAEMQRRESIKEAKRNFKGKTLFRL